MEKTSLVIEELTYSKTPSPERALNYKLKEIQRLLKQKHQNSLFVKIKKEHSKPIAKLIKQLPEFELTLTENEEEAEPSNLFTTPLKQNYKVSSSVTPENMKYLSSFSPNSRTPNLHSISRKKSLYSSTNEDTVNHLIETTRKTNIKEEKCQDLEFELFDFRRI